MDLVKGTKENVVATLADRTGAIDDLTPYSPTFTVENNVGTVIQASSSCTVVDQMTVLCLIDTTTNPLTWVKGLHKVYVTMTILGEAPKILAGEFLLI